MLSVYMPGKVVNNSSCVSMRSIFGNSLLTKVSSSSRIGTIGFLPKKDRLIRIPSAWNFIDDFVLRFPSSKYLIFFGKRQQKEDKEN